MNIPRRLSALFIKSINDEDLRYKLKIIFKEDKYDQLIEKAIIHSYIYDNFNLNHICKQFKNCDYIKQFMKDSITCNYFASNSAPWRIKTFITFFGLNFYKYENEFKKCHCSIDKRRINKIINEILNETIEENFYIIFINHDINKFKSTDFEFIFEDKYYTKIRELFNKKIEKITYYRYNWLFDINNFKDYYYYEIE